MGEPIPESRRRPARAALAAAERLLRRWGPAALALAVLAAYATVQWRNFAPASADPDAEGFLRLAHRMARGEPVAVTDFDPFLYHEYWFVLAPCGLVPKFYPGWPALLSLAERAWGLAAASALGPVMGGLALAGCWLLLRRWMRPLPASLGMAALAAHPAFLAFSMQPLPYVPALCLLVWAVYLLCLWVRRPDPVRGLAAGLLLGCGATMHPAALAAVAVAACAMASRWVRGRRTGRLHPGSMAALLIGCAVPLVLLAGYNAAVYGGAFRTGYALAGQGLSLRPAEWAAQHVAVVRDLGHEALLYILPLGLAATVAVIGRAERACRAVWLAAVWMGIILHPWITAAGEHRGALLLLYPLAVGCAFGLFERLRISRAAGTAAAVLMAALMLASVRAPLRRAWAGQMNEPARAAASLLRAVEPVLREDAVIFLGRDLHGSLRARHDYRIYELQAFEPSYEPPSDPPHQRERAAFLQQFYDRMRGGTSGGRRRRDDERHARAFGERLRVIARAQIAGNPQVVLWVQPGELKRYLELLGAGFRAEPLLPDQGLFQLKAP